MKSIAQHDAVWAGLERLPRFVSKLLRSQAGDFKKPPVEIGKVLITRIYCGGGDIFIAVHQPSAYPSYANFIDVTLKCPAHVLLEPA